MDFFQERQDIRDRLDIVTGLLPDREKYLDYAVGLLQVEQRAIGELEGDLYPTVRQWLGNLSGKCVADLGCGDGLFLPWLQGRRSGFGGQTPCRIVAVDESPVLLSLARLAAHLHPSIEYHQLRLGARHTALDTLRPDRGFDCVVLGNLLPYLSDVEVTDTLAHARDLIEPARGTLVVTCLDPRFVLRMNWFSDAVNPEDQYRSFRKPSFGNVVFHCRPIEEWYECRFREAGFEIAARHEVEARDLGLEIPMYRAHCLVPAERRTAK